MDEAWSGKGIIGIEVSILETDTRQYADCFILIIFVISGASEIVASTVAHRATVKALASDLSSFEEDVSVFDKRPDSDEEDESKMDRKVIKGECTVSNDLYIVEVCKSDWIRSDFGTKIFISDW